jgi:hypothetical protein
MSSTRHHIRVITRLVAPIALTAAVVGLGAGPSSALTDPGPTVPQVGHAGECTLERVGTQFVRCDDLTGDGVPAPAFIPER